MPNLQQNADARWPLADEPEVIAVTDASAATCLRGCQGVIADDDAGKMYDWVAETGDVYCVLWVPSAMGAVSGSGTAPPTMTVAGVPFFSAALRVDVNATDGTLAGSTFDWSVNGVTIGTAVAPVSSVLTLAYNEWSLACTFAAGTFNADNYWTSTPTATAADNTATSGATVPFIVKAGQNPVRRALPDLSGTANAKALAISCIVASGTGKLRFWPSSGK